MKNKLLRICIGLFSNLQGLEIGARKAGFSTPFSTDIEPLAQVAAPIIHNDPGKSVFYVKDIKQLRGTEVDEEMKKLHPGISAKNADLLVGGPACFGMTSINTKQRSVFHSLNFLMIEMLRMVKELQPKVVLIEQVPALLTKPMRLFYLLFINAIERLGNYHWDYRELNAANYGCFQSRNRVIFMLVRKDLGVCPSFPAPLPIDLSKQSAYATIGAELIRTEMYKKASGGRVRILEGRTNVFPTMTSDQVFIYRNGLWQDLSVEDRAKLAHMDEYDLSSVLDENVLIKKLGMMVLPPFAEALCRHVYDEILDKSINIDTSLTAA